MPGQSGSVWLKEVTLLRGFAILGVLILHTAGSIYNFYETPFALLILAFHVLSIFSVPIFFFISGLVLAHSYGPSFRAFQFYKKRAYVLLSLLISLLFFFVFPGTLGYLLTWKGSWPGHSDVILTVFLLGAKTPLWFCVAMLQLYATYPLLVKLRDYFGTGSGSMILVLWSYLAQVIWLLMGGVEFIALSNVVYFAFGMFIGERYMYFKEKTEKTKRPFIALAVVLALFWMLLYAWYNLAKYKLISAQDSALALEYILIVLLQPMAFACLVLLLLRAAFSQIKKNGVAESVLYHFGNHSFVIYLIHPISISLVLSALYVFCVSRDDILFYAVLTASSVLVSYALARALHAMPFSKTIFGKNK